MRKRLRKKKHLGEFKEWCVTVEVHLDPEVDYQAFLDDWIERAIEGNQCQFGGGGKSPLLEGIIQLGMASHGPQECLTEIRDWLEQHPAVQEYQFGPLIDCWYDSGDAN